MEVEPHKLRVGSACNDGVGIEAAKLGLARLKCKSLLRLPAKIRTTALSIVGIRALNVLEAARQLNKKKDSRVYQASSSEMFGDVIETPQNEKTPFQPQSPYACAKVYAFHQTVNYRKGYSMFATNGILFNHELPRRGETFVTRKITRAATQINSGFKKNSTWVTSTPNETGVSRKTMLKACG